MKLINLDYNPKPEQGKLKCLKRDKNIKATPEEIVRQKVLAWLMFTVKIDKKLIVIEENQNYSNKRRGRPDILIKNRHNTPIMVIELKQPGVGIGYDVFDQAKKYANKSGANEIWLSNGTDHQFSRRTKSKWEEIEWSSALGLKVPKPEKPASPSPKDNRGMKKLLTEMANLNNRDFLQNRKLYPVVAAIQKIITMDKAKISLPFCYDELYILADRGTSKLSVQTPGGRWTGDYRLFLAATEHRVETIGIGLQIWDENNIILCVVVIKDNRKHNALQLRLPDFSKLENKGWSIHHNGRIGGRSLPSSLVLESIREAGLNILTKDDKFPIDLGLLPNYSNVTWKNTRIFLSNLFHYCLIRSNLRDSNPYEHAKKRH